MKEWSDKRASEPAKLILVTEAFAALRRARGIYRNDGHQKVRFVDVHHGHWLVLWSMLAADGERASKRTVSYRMERFALAPAAVMVVF